MSFSSSREYRSIEMSGFEPSEDGYIVEGYATTFDEPYDFGDGMRERVLSTALDGADMSDVIFQYNHEGMVLARQRNATLSLDKDEHGLHVRADLGGTEAGRNLYEAIKSGLVDRMSWGFTIAEGGWDYDSYERLATISKIKKVYDVSAVSFPANEGTEIAARSLLFDGVIEAERQELLERERDAERRKRRALLMEITR